MASTYWDTIQIKEMPGRKKVTENQKNATIERAVSTWKSMGLADPQIAFGTAVMGHKSGFDANAGGMNEASDEYGLGQFTQNTWRDAVDYYNENYRPIIENAAKAKADPDAQIRVMGAWVPRIWEAAGDIAWDPSVKRYDQKQIAYGIWNQGQDADAKDVGLYLNRNWRYPDTGGYFDTTYDRAMQGLSLRKNYLDAVAQQEDERSDGSGGNNGASANVSDRSSKNTTSQKGQQIPPGIPTADQEGLKETFGPYAVAGRGCCSHQCCCQSRSNNRIPAVS